MKKILTLVLTLVLIAALVACGASPAPAAQSSAPPAADNSADDAGSAVAEPAAADGGFTCLISESPRGAPFTDQTWLGFEKIAEEYGTEIKLVEALDKAEYEEQIRSMAEMGANPIYTMFDAVNEVAIRLAPEYPEVRFCLIDSNIEVDGDNVTNVLVDSFEPSFVAGYIAAHTSENGYVGWIGMLDIPVINRFRDGYVAGVNYANEVDGLDVKVETAYTGSDVDTVKGSEAAKLMIDKGVDVIFQAANQSGLGVIQACDEMSVKCIGVDVWQGDLSPMVFWSALIDIDGAVFDSYTAATKGELPSGLVDYGLKTGSKIFDERDYNNLPDELRGKLDTLQAGIIDNSIDIFTYEVAA